MKPKLFFIDGTDGSGKTETRNILEAHLTEQGMKVLTLSFPGHDDFGQFTRPWFINNSEDEYTKLLAILTEFSRFLEAVKNGKYDEYDYVIADRFVLSTIHQVNLNLEYLPLVKHFVDHYQIRDIPYIVLTTDPDTAKSRVYDRGSVNEGDRKAMREKETTCFIEHARNLKLGKNVYVICNNGTLEELKEAVLLKYKVSKSLS